MTEEQKRGRTYMLVAILTVLIFDIAVNALSLFVGILAWSDVVRTALTVLLCWFVWRGSQVGYVLLLLCVGLGLLYAVLVARQMPILISGLFLSVMGGISIALLAPATRAFSAFQRREPAQQAATEAHNSRA